MRAQGHTGDDAESAAAALQRPEEVGVRAGVGELHVAVGGHDLRFEEACRGEAIAFGKASEAAAEDQAGDADGHAAAALDVAPTLGRHRVVSLSPICPRLYRHRRLRLRAPLAAGADKGVLHDDFGHAARPDQKRVWRVRCSLVRVAAALHHEPEVVGPGEIHRGGDILRRFGGDRIGARPRRPGADPAERLRQPDLVAEIVRVLELLEHLGACRIGRRSDARAERRTDLDKASADLAAEALPAFIRGPRRIPGADSRGARRRRRRGWRGQPLSQSPGERKPCDDLQEPSPVHSRRLPCAAKVTGKSHQPRQ